MSEYCFIKNMILSGNKFNVGGDDSGGEGRGSCWWCGLEGTTVLEEELGTWFLDVGDDGEGRRGWWWWWWW